MVEDVSTVIFQQASTSADMGKSSRQSGFGLVEEPIVADGIDTIMSDALVPASGKK